MNLPTSENSSLKKLQTFVNDHNVKENRYLSSPILMHFDENPLTINLEDKPERSLKIEITENNYPMSDSEDEDFIDIETITSCDVTSTTEKVKLVI